MKRAALTLPAGTYHLDSFRPGSDPVRWLIFARRFGFALDETFIDFRQTVSRFETVTRDVPVTFATRDFDTLSAATEFALTFQHSDLELVWTEVADV